MIVKTRVCKFEEVCNRLRCYLGEQLNSYLSVRRSNSTFLGHDFVVSGCIYELDLYSTRFETEYLGGFD